MKVCRIAAPATLTLNELAPLLPAGELSLSGVTARLASVRRGMLFVATEGSAAVVEEAISRGAVAIASEGQSPDSCSVPWFRVQDALRLLGHVASRFAAEPSQKIAVTVTAGGPARRALQQAIARVETDASTGAVAEKLASVRGPGSESLQRRLLAHIRSARRSVVLECRAEDLRRGRLEGIRIASLVIAVGASRESDEHATLLALLARLPEDAVVVMDADDPATAEFTHATRALVVTAGQSPAADISWRVLRRDRQGQTLECVSPLGRACLALPAIDHGSATIAVLAFAHAVVHGTSPAAAANALAEKVSGPEALWRLALPAAFDVWQARGRSRDSLERALVEIRPFTKGRVLLVSAQRGLDGDFRREALREALSEAGPGDALLVMSGEEHAADRALIQEWFLGGLTGAA